MKTTVEIPDALFAEAKEYAARRKLSFKEVIEFALRQTLTAQRKPPARFRLRDGSVKGRGLAPGMDGETIRRHIYKGRGE